MSAAERKVIPFLSNPVSSYSHTFVIVKIKHWHYFGILLMRGRATWDNAPKGNIPPRTSASVPVRQELMSYANGNNFLSPASFDLPVEG